MNKIILSFIIVIAFMVNDVSANDYNNKTDYLKIDERAKNVPSHFDEDLDRLVVYLTRPFTGDHEKTARVLYAWIAFHIDYDEYKQEQIDDGEKNVFNFKTNVENTFEKRLGNFYDISKLYQKMGKKAGLDVKEIRGYLKIKSNRNLDRDSRHAWNQVRINGIFKNVDPTFTVANGFYRNFNDGEYNNAINKRVLGMNKEELYKARQNAIVKDKWFLIDDGEFQKTHDKKREE